MGLEKRVQSASIETLREEVRALQKYAYDKSLPEIVRATCANKLTRHWTVLQREMVKRKEPHVSSTSENRVLVRDSNTKLSLYVTK